MEHSVRTPSHTPLERALCSLEGLSVGDAFGERFFVHPDTVEHLIAARALPAPRWRFTDDTQMALSSWPYVPTSEVASRLRRARDLSDGAPVQSAVAVLGNGSGVSAQDTVPFALWCAAQHLDNYEEALWLTVSGLGDRDRACAIVGGIVSLHTGVEGIPATWRRARETLPRMP